MSRESPGKENSKPKGPRRDRAWCIPGFVGARVYVLESSEQELERGPRSSWRGQQGQTFRVLERSLDLKFCFYCYNTKNIDVPSHEGGN